MTGSAWVQINRDYLLASLRRVKAILRHNHPEKAEGKETPEEVIEKASDELEQLRARCPGPTALDGLTETLGLSSFEKDLLVLCAGMELDHALAVLVASIQGMDTQRAPTFSLALATLPDPHWSALLPDGPLRHWRLIRLHQGTLLTQSALTIDESILHYLTGIQILDSDLQLYFHPELSTPSLPGSHESLARQLAHMLSTWNPAAPFPIIHLSGPDQADKIAIAQKTLLDAQWPMFRLALNLLPQNLSELQGIIRLWNRQTALQRVALYVDGESPEQKEPGYEEKLQFFLEEVQGIVLLGAETWTWELRRDVVEIPVEKPTRQEQEEAWNINLPQSRNGQAKSMNDLSTQFNFDSRTIGRMARTAILMQGVQGESAPGLDHTVWEVCRRHTRKQLEGLAQRIEPMAEWEDLVLPLRQMDTLRDIGAHVQQRQKVYQDWGFAGKSKRGLGISALFAGESGTGKTMAAEVLARALALDLYRIDLSQVVNKYIGETEKNLKKIFDAAEESGAILLFDEADALFGKRSEVKDSHDRYANIEVSYLLQRMESYRGLAILTTNMKNALDKAFLRRIRFVVNFPFPNASMRAEIWRRIIPAATPTRNLNFHKLARLNVAGGNIKNIMMNAAFMAAHHDQPVTMEFIQMAARSEYEKLDKPMSPGENLI